jgi:hypothetical protein
VIQPFDGGMFDARYEDVIAPAVTAAGLEPYRVDRDPKVSIPIQDIESGIRNARICLAEITLDNPNVWFELGFAIASFKDVVLVCSDARATKFPFDVQHRAIIKYGTGSPRDFDQLKENITKRILAFLEKEQNIQAAADVSMLQKIQGLEQHEVVTLAAIGENIASITDIAAGHRIRQDMERAGFNNLATTIGLKSLADHGLIAQEELEDEEGYKYPGYRLTESGWQWILANKHEFVLKRKVRSPAPIDEIPF